MLSTSPISAANSTPAKSSANAVDGCYAFSPSPGTAASSYLSVMDRLEEFDCHVPTKETSASPQATSQPGTHARNGRGTHAMYDMPHNGADSSRQLRDAARPLAREAGVYLLSSLSNTNAAKHWVDGIPISPIHASRTPVRREGHTAECPCPARLNSASAQMSASSAPAPSASVITRGPALLETTALSQHASDGDIAALRFNLHALLQQAAPDVVSTDAGRSSANRISPASSNKSATNPIPPSNSPQISHRTTPDQLPSRSNTGLPPPSPNQHSSSADVAMHYAAMWPSQPPSHVYGHPTTTDDGAMHPAPPMPPKRPVSASNTFSRPSHPSNGIDAVFRTGGRQSPSSHRTLKSPLLGMSDDPLMRAIATEPPHGLSLSTSERDRSGAEHSRSRLREEVRQARAQQEFDTQAGQLARRIDEHLELVFALMRRVMIFDAQHAMLSRAKSSPEWQEGSDGAATALSSSLGQSKGIEDEDAMRIRGSSDTLRDSLVSQLESREDEAVSYTLSYVELTNRHALQWMNKGHFSAALQLLRRADGLLRKDAGRLFRYLPDPVELRAALISSAGDAGESTLITSSLPPAERSGEEGMRGAQSGDAPRPGSGSGQSSEHVRSINVPFFPPSQEPARLKAAAAVEHNLGIYHFKIGEYAIAASRFTRAALLEEELQAPGVGITYFNMAQTQHELRDMPEALHYVKLAEEAVERQVFASKDAATRMRRHLAQHRAFTLADLSENSLAALEAEGDAFLSNRSVSSAEASQCGETSSQLTSHCAEVRAHVLREDPRHSAAAAPGVAEHSEAARERELLQLWMQWREGVCFMSCVKETHAEWLHEMGQYKASYHQYLQAHRWLVSVPRLAPEEQQRAQRLKEQMTKTKRKWRREEVEMELYHRPLTRSEVSSAAATPSRRSSSLSHRQRYLQPHVQHGGRSSGTRARAVHSWRGLPTPLQSTVVTSVLPRAVEVAGARRDPNRLASHPPPHPVRVAHDSHPEGSAATSSSAIAPSPVSVAARRSRPNSANAAMYSAYMSRPSVSRHAQRYGRKEPGPKAEPRLVHATHPPAVEDPQPPAQCLRPGWDASMRVPVPPAEPRHSSRPASGTSSRRDSTAAAAVHRTSISASTSGDLHPVSFASAVEREDVVVQAASDVAAQDTRRAVQPLPEMHPSPLSSPLTPKHKLQHHQEQERYPQHIAESGPAAFAAAPESVARSLLFDEDAKTPKRQPVVSQTPPSPQQNSAPLEIEKEDEDHLERSTDDSSEEEEEVERVERKETSPASVGETSERDEEGDEVDVSVSSSEASSVASEIGLPAARRRGDLTWCAMVLQAFLRCRLRSDRGLPTFVTSEGLAPEELALEAHSIKESAADAETSVERVSTATAEHSAASEQDEKRDDRRKEGEEDVTVVEPECSDEDAVEEEEERSASASVAAQGSLSVRRSTEVVMMPPVALPENTPLPPVDPSPLLLTGPSEESLSNRSSVASHLSEEAHQNSAARDFEDASAVEEHQRSDLQQPHSTDSSVSALSEVCYQSPTEMKTSQLTDQAENAEKSQENVEEEEEDRAEEAAKGLLYKGDDVLQATNDSVELGQGRAVVENSRKEDVRGDEQQHKYAAGEEEHLPILYASKPESNVFVENKGERDGDADHAGATKASNQLAKGVDARCDDAVSLRTSTTALSRASVNAAVHVDGVSGNAADTPLFVSQDSGHESSLDRRSFLSADALVDVEDEEDDTSSSLSASSDQYASASWSASSSSNERRRRLPTDSTGMEAASEESCTESLTSGLQEAKNLDNDEDGEASAHSSKRSSARMIGHAERTPITSGNDSEHDSSARKEVGLSEKSEQAGPCTQLGRCSPNSGANDDDSAHSGRKEEEEGDEEREMVVEKKRLESEFAAEAPDSTQAVRQLREQGAGDRARTASSESGEFGHSSALPGEDEVAEACVDGVHCDEALSQHVEECLDIEVERSDVALDDKNVPEKSDASTDTQASIAEQCTERNNHLVKEGSHSNALRAVEEHAAAPPLESEDSTHVEEQNITAPLPPAGPATPPSKATAPRELLQPDSLDESPAEVHLLRESSSSGSTGLADGSEKGGPATSDQALPVSCSDAAGAPPQNRAKSPLDQLREDQQLRVERAATAYLDVDDAGNFTFVHPKEGARKANGEVLKNAAALHAAITVAAAAAAATAQDEEDASAKPKLRHCDTEEAADHKEATAHQETGVTERHLAFASSSEGSHHSPGIGRGSPSRTAERLATPTDSSTAATEERANRIAACVQSLQFESATEGSEDARDALHESSNILASSGMNHSHAAASVVAVPPTFKKGIWEDALRTKSSTATVQPGEEKKVLTQTIEGATLPMASAHSCDSGLQAFSASHSSRETVRPAVLSNTSAVQQDGDDAKKVVRTPEKVCQPPATLPPRRARVFVFAPPRIATPATAELTQFTATSSARSESNERSPAHDAAAAVHAGCTGCTLPSATHSVYAVGHAYGEEEGTLSLVHLSPSLTTGSPDAPLSFTECFYCDLPPEEDTAGRRGGSSNSTATQLSQLRASFWRSLHDRGEYKAEDGVLRGSRSPLKYISSGSISNHIMAAVSRAGISVNSVMPKTPIAAAPAAEHPTEHSDRTIDQDSDEAKSEQLAFQQQFISQHGIDITDDADAPPFRARPRPSVAATGEGMESASPTHQVAHQTQEIGSAGGVAAPALALPNSLAAVAASPSTRSVTAVEKATAELESTEEAGMDEVRVEGEEEVVALAEAVPVAFEQPTSPTREVAVKEDSATRAEGGVESSLPQQLPTPSASVAQESSAHSLKDLELMDAVAAAYLHSGAIPQRDSDAFGNRDGSEDDIKRAPADLSAQRKKKEEEAIGNGKAVSADGACLPPPPPPAALSPSPEEQAAHSTPPQLPHDDRQQLLPSPSALPVCVPDNAEESRSPTKVAVSLFEDGVNTDEMDVEEEERRYIRAQILREESATVIQQAWRKFLALRHPQRPYTMW